MPSKAKKRVDICVATYKRPELLAALLESIQEMEIPEGFEISVIVIDNDRNRTAETVVDSVLGGGTLSYQYDVQPEQNIALTRNKALDHAKGEYAAFVDDDETVEKDWLGALLRTKERFEADVVFGPVIAQYPIDTPEWIKKGRFFERHRFKTGTVVHRGGTGNALVDLESGKLNPSIRFDSRYGLSGGEDAELFFRLRNRGCKFVWSDKAVVYETVIRERMNVAWLLRRAFRGGQTTARIHNQPAFTHTKLLWFIIRIGLLGIAITAALLALPFGKPYWVLAARKVMSNAGQLSIVFVENYFQEYGEKR